MDFLDSPEFLNSLEFQDMVWFGIDWYGFVWFHMVLFGMVLFSLWFGLVWYGMVWYGLRQHPSKVTMKVSSKSN